MWICQQPQFNACAPTIDVGSDPILSNSELFALLELVIPGDEPLTPIDRQPTTALSSNEFLALLNLVIPGNDASLTAVDMELPTYDFTRHSWEPEFEPGTSFLRPEPAFDAVDSGVMLTIAQPCKLVTPVEIFQGPFVPIIQDAVEDACAMAVASDAVPSAALTERKQGVFASAMAAERAAQCSSATKAAKAVACVEHTVVAGCASPLAARKAPNARASVLCTPHGSAWSMDASASSEEEDSAGATNTSSNSSEQVNQCNDHRVQIR
ncbi:hypothetical protein ON010_g6136 [Phytophthora cinnamomi]|nr:hypothetical protein ON010_g6136 [Phytophthora cinnamomi]